MERHFSHITADFSIQYKKRDFEYQMPILHYHNSYEIYFLEEGNRNVLINEQLFNISRCDVVLFKPTTLHRNIGGTNHSRTVVYFTNEFLNQYFTIQTQKVLLSCFEENIMSVDQEVFKHIKELLLKLEKENLANKDNRIFISLFELLMTLSDNKKGLNQSTSLDSTANTNANIAPILSYIGQNYKTLSNISEIADAFFITKFHLCRIFKQATGLTITQYINDLKIHQACELLRQTNQSITEIGFACGFNSTMYFCKTFKNITDMTPNGFRQHMEGKN